MAYTHGLTETVILDIMTYCHYNKWKNNPIKFLEFVAPYLGKFTVFFILNYTFQNLKSWDYATLSSNKWTNALKRKRGRWEIKVNEAFLMKTIKRIN